MNKLMPRLVRASSMSATYNAGVFCTETDVEATDMAREQYADSSMGRTLHDVGAFRFYVVGRGADAYADEAGR